MKQPVVSPSDFLVQTDFEAIRWVYQKFIREGLPLGVNEFGLCSYSGGAVGCAAGCLMTHEKRVALDVFANVYSKRISGLIRQGDVKLPDGMTVDVMCQLQQWHDGLVCQDTPEERWKSFPFQGIIQLLSPGSPSM